MREEIKDAIEALGEQIEGIITREAAVLAESMKADMIARLVGAPSVKPKGKSVKRPKAEPVRTPTGKKSSSKIPLEKRLAKLGEPTPKKVQGSRRFFSQEYKDAIIAESKQPGVRIIDLQRREGLSKNAIFAWLREARKKR